MVHRASGKEIPIHIHPTHEEGIYILGVVGLRSRGRDRYGECRRCCVAVNGRETRTVESRLGAKAEYVHLSYNERAKGVSLVRK